jgi:hypothetical protein
MGLIFNVPFWIFYSSSQSLDSLTQLKGKRIAVGPEESGARFLSERILSRANIDAKTATLLPLAGDAAVDALNKGAADAAVLVGGSDAPSVESLPNNPNVRLMNFTLAVVQLDPPNPPDDITLVGTTAKVLIRDDREDPLATTKDEPLPTTTANDPAHTDNPNEGNRATGDPNYGAKRRVVSGQRLWSDLGGGPFLRPISVRVCDQLKPAHSQPAER